MYCQKCGAEIPAGQNVCPKCYTPVRGSGLFGRLLGWLFGRRSSAPLPGPPGTGRMQTNVVRRTEHIQLTDATTGEKRVYHSLDEVPPEIRERIEALRAEGGGAQTQQTVTFRDGTGREQTYHSVDEMPPDVRAIYERIKKERGLGL